jgi:prevent-host-death family protein
MVTVGIRNLKDRLSSYLAMVKKGETIVVTDRGKEVARIVPTGPDEEELPEWYKKLVAEGKITDKGRLRVADIPPGIPMTPGDKSIVDYVLEQRR